MLSHYINVRLFYLAIISVVNDNKYCSYCPFPEISINHKQFNILRPRKNSRHFANEILKYIFLYENIWILIKIPLRYVHTGPINNIPTLVQIMAWCWSSDKTLSEPMTVSLLMHIFITRPQWVNTLRPRQNRRHFAEGIFKCIFLNEN